MDTPRNSFYFENIMNVKIWVAQESRNDRFKLVCVALSLFFQDNEMKFPSDP